MAALHHHHHHHQQQQLLMSTLSSGSSSSPPLPLSSCRPKRRHCRAPIAVRSSSSGGGVVPKEEEEEAKSSSSSIIQGQSKKAKSSSIQKEVMLTYLEINSWLWEVGGWRILVDPILAGNLDFGAPWLFDAAKKRLKNLAVDDVLSEGVDLVLITQSLDDHCHARTLSQIAAAAPDLPVLTTPNARPVLAALPFRHVTYLQPGDNHMLYSNSNGGGWSVLRILATPGPVLGPPWQRPENGYILTLLQQQQQGGGGGGGEEDDEIMSLYYEPHCVYDRSFFLQQKQEKGRIRADVVITPVVKQLLPGNFTLVAGQEDAVELATLLGARYVVPMSNGDVDAKGLLTSVLSTQGTLHAFKAMLSDSLPEAQLLHPTPGLPLHLHF